MRCISTWSLKAASVAALSLAASACTLDVETHRDRRYYDDGRPVVVERRYAYRPDHVVVVAAAPADQVTVVTEAPPPLYVEPIPVAPGPEFVWVGGYWVVSGGGWVWVHGRYDRPPNRGAHWVGHAWVQNGDRWELHKGGWH